MVFEIPLDFRGREMMSEKLSNIHFHWVDYTVFGLMIVLSAATGIYFGYFRKRQLVQRRFKEADKEEAADGTREKDFGSARLNDYLLGSKKMHPFPVAMSLVGGYISGVTMLGTPSEIYYYGTQYWFIIIPVCLMAITVSFVFLPVFSILRVGSSYQYLELRFGKLLRTLASIVFVIDELLFLPIIVYVPALAFNQVTGVNLYIIVAIITVVCVIYTIIGGIKAVVATDAWQIAVMFLSVLIIVIIGTVKIGGIGVVFERASEGGGLIFANLETSMYERQSLMAVLIGGTSFWISFNSVNQTMVQRYMSLPNLKESRVALYIFAFGIVCFITACVYAGLLIYATYYKCDPASMNWITRDDQLFPIYVMQTAGGFYGIPGLFIAGVCGAALSSLSVVLNATGAIIMEDLVKGALRIKLTDIGYTILVKVVILILGILAMALVFAVEKLGALLELATSFSAIAAATSFGMFFLGMLIPWSNQKGAFAGAICGFLMSAWITFGTQITRAQRHTTTHKLPVSVEECSSNGTLLNFDDNQIVDDSDIFPLYRLSFHWINPIGVFTTVIIGTIVSFMTGATKLNTVDAALISPVLHRFLPKECFINSIIDEATTINPQANKNTVVITSKK